MNRFNLKTLLLLLPFFAFAWGCDNDDDELLDRRPGNVTVTDSMVLSHTDYTFGIEGGSFTLTVNSSVKYTISSYSPWLRVSGSEDTYKVAAGVTDSYDVREAVVYVTSADKSLKDTLRVSQASLSGLFLSKEQREQTVAAVAGEMEVLLYFTDAGFSVTPLVEWIHYLGTKSLAEATLRLKVDANGAYEERSGKVAIASVDGVYKDTLTVIQKEKQDLVVYTTSFDAVSKAGEVLTVEYAENMGETVEALIPEDIDWITPVATKALSPGELYLKVEENKLAEVRTAVITVACGELSREVTITQEPGDLSLELITHSAIVANIGEIVTVAYNCLAGRTVSAEIPTDISWITVVSAKALITGEIQLKVDENPFAQERKASVYITDGSAKEEFVITQKAAKDPLWENEDYSTKIIDLGNKRFLVNKNCDASTFSSKITGAAEGSEFYLRDGCSFSYSKEVAFKKGVSIIGEPDAAKMPLIRFTAKQFNVSKSSVLGDLIFKNIELVSASYVFDITQSDDYTSVIGSLQFINCYIHDVESALLRTRQPKGKIGKLIIDQCIISQTGKTGKDQALISSAGNGGPAGEMELTITNSTFNDCSNVRDRNLINFSKATMSSIKVTIENNTFYKCAGHENGFAIVNLIKEVADVATISVRKNIIVGTTAYGVNVNEGTPVSSVIDGNCVPQPISSFDDPNLIMADPGFAAPADGDFTVTNAGVKAAGVGDPRWLK